MLSQHNNALPFGRAFGVKMANFKNERFVNFRYVLVAEYEQNVNFEKMGYSKWHFFLLYNRGVYNFIWKWGIKTGPKCRYIRRINSAGGQSLG